MCVCICMCDCVCMRVRVCVCVHGVCTHIHTHTHTHTYTCVRAHTYVRTYVCMYVRMVYVVHTYDLNFVMCGIFHIYCYVYFYLSIGNRKMSNPSPPLLVDDEE